MTLINYSYRNSTWFRYKSNFCGLINYNTTVLHSCNSCKHNTIGNKMNLFYTVVGCKACQKNPKTKGIINARANIPLVKCNPQ